MSHLAHLWLANDDWRWQPCVYNVPDIPEPLWGLQRATWHTPPTPCCKAKYEWHGRAGIFLIYASSTKPASSFPGKTYSWPAAETNTGPWRASCANCRSLLPRHPLQSCAHEDAASEFVPPYAIRLSSPAWHPGNGYL